MAISEETFQAIRALQGNDLAPSYCIEDMMLIMIAYNMGMLGHNVGMLYWKSYKLRNDMQHYPTTILMYPFSKSYNKRHILVWLCHSTKHGHNCFQVH